MIHRQDSIPFVCVFLRWWCSRAPCSSTNPLSTETDYQQDLINRDLLSTSLIVGKLGPGMWCDKFNSTSTNVLVCETQRKMNHDVWVCQ